MFCSSDIHSFIYVVVEIVVVFVLIDSRNPVEIALVVLISVLALEGVKAHMEVLLVLVRLAAVVKEVVLVAVEIHDAGY